jgi:hypothetical protein
MTTKTRLVLAGAALAVALALVAPARADDAAEPARPEAGEVWRTPTAVLPAPGTKILRLDFGSTLSPPSYDYDVTGRLAFAAVVDTVELKLAAGWSPLVPAEGPIFVDAGVRVGLRRAGWLRVAALADLTVGGLPTQNGGTRTLGAGGGAAASACWERDCRSMVSVAGELAYAHLTNDGAEVHGTANRLLAAATLSAIEALGDRVALFALGRAGRGIAPATTGALGPVAPELLQATAGIQVWPTRGRLSIAIAASVVKLVSDEFLFRLLHEPDYLLGGMLQIPWGAPT